MQKLEEDIQEDVLNAEAGSYELLYILSGNLTESEVAPIVESVKELLLSKGARIEYEELWGKQRLAYAIKHVYHGYYFLLQFTAPKGNIEPLNREFRMRPEILRSQIIRIVLPTEAEREKLREAKLKRLKEFTEEDKKEMVKEMPDEKPYKREEKKESTPQDSPVSTAPSPKAVNLEELDKKLDALLEDDGMQNIL